MKGISVLESNGTRVSDDVERANLRNHTFARKFSDPAVAHFPNIPFSINETLTNFHVTEQTVCRLLKDLVVCNCAILAAQM